MESKDSKHKDDILRQNTDEATRDEGSKQEPSVTGVIIHSFFIIPFLIAVVCVMVFFFVSLLVREPRTIYDYIDDIKTGSESKRWQSAFELSKILANPERIPQEQVFVDKMASAFHYASRPEDYQVRYYLALAMGATRNEKFAPLLLKALQQFDKNSLNGKQVVEIEGLIRSLGLLKSTDAVPTLHQFLSSNEVRVRLNVVVSLGHIGHPDSRELLIARLEDEEANVRWDAAIALAKMKDPSGKDILLHLLDREYYKKYPNVERREQTYAIIIAMEAASRLDDPQLREAISKLAESDHNMKVRTRAMELSRPEK